MSDNILDIGWLLLDTSITQARSRIDGRKYPVEPLSGDQLRELAGTLGLAIDPRVAWALNDAVRASVRNLAAFFDAGDPATVAKYEGQRSDELRRISADPARALLSPTDNPGAQGARDLLLGLAEQQGFDPEITVGAVAMGNLAACLLQEKPPRADYRFRVGEEGLFDDIVAVIILIAPEQIHVIPSNENRGTESPALAFASEFIVQAVDRVRASFPHDDAVQERLDKLKNKSMGAILDGVRLARQWHRKHPPEATTTTDVVDF